MSASASMQLYDGAEPGRQPAVSLVVPLFAYGMASVGVLLATDVLNRYGVASPLWAAVYGMTLLYVAIFTNAVLLAFGRAFWLWIYPLACLASVMWSSAPGISLVSTVQLIMTIAIAAVIGLHFSLRQIIWIIFSVILLTAFLSLVNWQTGVLGPVWAGSGGLLGVYPQKNALGQRCLIGLLAAVAIILAPKTSRANLVLVLFPGLFVMLLALGLSKSATSILLLPPFLALFLALSWKRFNYGVVALTVACVSLIVGLFPLALALTGLDPASFVLDLFNKSATLTGRTEIWDIAEMVINDHWVFGVGYMAFWRTPEFSNLAWLAQEIGGEKVMGFHNFILEIWVGNGILGIFAIAVFVLGALSQTIKLYVATFSVESVFAIIAIAASLMMALLGTSLYRQHEFSIMLVVMLAVSASQQLRSGARIRMVRISSDEEATSSPATPL